MLRSWGVARAFSDPPMNLVEAEAVDGGLRLRGGANLPVDLPGEASRSVTVGIRASALRETARPGDIGIPGEVELAEISGSDTFVHVNTAQGELVAQLTGVHEFDLGAHITLHIDPSQVYVFDRAGDLVRAPRRQEVKA